MENSILFRTTDILSEKRCFSTPKLADEKCTRKYIFHQTTITKIGGSDE